VKKRIKRAETSNEGCNSIPTTGSIFRSLSGYGGAALQHNQPRGVGPLLEPRMSSISISALSILEPLVLTLGPLISLTYSRSNSAGMGLMAHRPSLSWSSRDISRGFNVVFENIPCPHN
jgi:hypothetical protein